MCTSAHWNLARIYVSCSLTLLERVYKTKGKLERIYKKSSLSPRRRVYITSGVAQQLSRQLAASERTNKKGKDDGYVMSKRKQTSQRADRADRCLSKQGGTNKRKRDDQSRHRNKKEILLAHPRTTAKITMVKTTAKIINRQHALLRAAF